MLPVPAGAEGLYILASLFSLPKKKKRVGTYHSLQMVRVSVTRGRVTVNGPVAVMVVG